MKILFVITLAELGGAQSVVINLANTRCERGHKVYVASSEEGKMWEMPYENVIRVPIKTLERNINKKDFRVLYILRNYTKASILM